MHAFLAEAAQRDALLVQFPRVIHSTISILQLVSSVALARLIVLYLQSLLNNKCDFAQGLFLMRQSLF